MYQRKTEIIENARENKEQKNGNENEKPIILALLLYCCIFCFLTVVRICMQQYMYTYPYRPPLHSQFGHYEKVRLNFKEAMT